MPASYVRTAAAARRSTARICRTAASPFIGVSMLSIVVAKQKPVPDVARALSKLSTAIMPRRRGEVLSKLSNAVMPRRHEEVLSKLSFAVMPWPIPLRLEEKAVISGD